MSPATTTPSSSSSSSSSQSSQSSSPSSSSLGWEPVSRSTSSRNSSSSSARSARDSDSAPSSLCAAHLASSERSMISCESGTRGVLALPSFSSGHDSNTCLNSGDRILSPTRRSPWMHTTTESRCRALRLTTFSKPSDTARSIKGGRNKSTSWSMSVGLQVTEKLLNSSELALQEEGKTRSSSTSSSALLLEYFASPSSVFCAFESEVASKSGICTTRPSFDEEGMKSFKSDRPASLPSPRALPLFLLLLFSSSLDSTTSLFPPGLRLCFLPELKTGALLLFFFSDAILVRNWTIGVQSSASTESNRRVWGCISSSFITGRNDFSCTAAAPTASFQFILNRPCSNRGAMRRTRSRCT
mmetsp:Transcript_25722/g.64765  ORF Transcript_25722/g.64765 Transcript_25722/m.64765 type:complete len:357 (-) Transcript_25722:3510-4580(-)